MSKYYRPKDRTDGLYEAVKQAWETQVKMIYDRGYEDGCRENEDEAYQKGFNSASAVKAGILEHERRKGFNEGYEKGLAFNTEFSNKEAYERGLDEAWELLMRVVDMPSKTKQDVFGHLEIEKGDWLLTVESFKEIKEKIEAFEQRQKQDATNIDVVSIKVGDEVRFVRADGSSTVGIVTQVRKSDLYCSVLWRDGNTSDCNMSLLEKTGRSFTSDLSNLLSMAGEADKEVKE